MSKCKHPERQDEECSESRMECMYWEESCLYMESINKMNISFNKCECGCSLVSNFCNGCKTYYG